jgi:phosphoglycerate dehydrogenase-like enzyme
MAQVKVLVAVFRESTGWVLQDEHLQKIRAVDPHLDVAVVADRKAFARELPAAEIVFGGTFTEELLATANKLHWIQATSAGVDRLLSRRVRDSDILLTSASGVHPIQVCEHVLGMMLMFSRCLHRCVRAQVAQEWAQQQVRNDLNELYERTVGVVGLGAIGSEIARRCKAFGMQVIGIRRNVSTGAPNVDVLLDPDGLERLLTDSDYVVLTVPLVADTHRLIGRRELKRMKRTAVLINVARGDVIDQEALIEALEDGRIGGAGLDVFEDEPLPADSPLYRSERVIVSPHVAGITPRYWQRCVELFCDNLRRYLAGERLANLVDKAAGY